MEILRLLRANIGILIIIVLIWAGATYMPKWQRSAPEPGYDDVLNIDLDRSMVYDATVPLHRYRIGDWVMYTIAEEGPGATCVGRVIAKPGNEVAIVAGKLTVDGAEARYWQTPPHTLERPPVPVPDNHLWVWSDYHQYDSLAFGPIPAAAILGRHGGD